MLTNKLLSSVTGGDTIIFTCTNSPCRKKSRGKLFLFSFAGFGRRHRLRCGLLCGGRRRFCGRRRGRLRRRRRSRRRGRSGRRGRSRRCRWGCRRCRARGRRLRARADAVNGAAWAVVGGRQRLGADDLSVLHKIAPSARLIAPVAACGKHLFALFKVLSTTYFTVLSGGISLVVWEYTLIVSHSFGCLP